MLCVPPPPQAGPPPAKLIFLFYFPGRPPAGLIDFISFFFLPRRPPAGFIDFFLRPAGLHTGLAPIKIIDLKFWLFDRGTEHPKKAPKAPPNYYEDPVQHPAKCLSALRVGALTRHYARAGAGRGKRACSNGARRTLLPPLAVDPQQRTNSGGRAAGNNQ